MAETDHTSKAATEATWALPLLALAPLAALRVITDLSTLWLALSWALVTLTVLLLAAGWLTVHLHGTRGRAAWWTCVLAHSVFAWQLTALVLQ